MNEYIRITKTHSWSGLPPQISAPFHTLFQSHLRSHFNTYMGRDFLLFSQSLQSGLPLKIHMVKDHFQHAIFYYHKYYSGISLVIQYILLQILTLQVICTFFLPLCLGNTLRQCVMYSGNSEFEHMYNTHILNLQKININRSHNI